MEAVMSQRQCEVDGCRRAAEAKRRYCRGHRERVIDGKPLQGEVRPYRRAPWETLMEAVFSFIEVDDSDGKGFERAKKRLRTAARRWVLASKKHARTRTGETPLPHPPPEGEKPN